MSITQTTTVILHDEYVTLSERARTTSAGTKSRYTVEVKAEPLVHEFSEEKLGEGPATAIAQAIRDQIKAIGQIAKPATLLARQVGKRALERGARWATERYAGGRTGAKPPSGAVRLFNDSGRLADSVVARQNPKERNWTVNVAANRLDPSTFKSQADLVAMYERLRELVPALKDPLSVDTVVRAIERGIRDVLIREMKRTNDLRIERAKAVLSLLGL